MSDGIESLSLPATPDPASPTGPLGDLGEAPAGSSRKRSKWEVAADAEDLANPKIKKKKKITIQLRPRDAGAELEEPAPSRPPEFIPEDQAERLSPRPPAHPTTRSRFVPPRRAHPSFQPCRSVFEYERLNHIEEGSYGIVFRARERATGDIVALKKLKLDEEKNGFPITSLREVMALMVCQHENVVGVREIVVGDTLTQVFIVMDFVEHDLKTLLSVMPAPFLQSEVKTLLGQLLSATAHCHANWILHRDLKTSNLLMNNRGMIKVADFGLARRFGDPLGDMTELVVTLWYRSPELLLGAKEYSTEVDVWSIGCIFAELINKEPLFQGKGEIDQIGQIFKLLGYPSDESWPGWTSLPLARSLKTSGSAFSMLRSKLPYITETGLDLMNQLLCYDPQSRISAEQALHHHYFSENPLPKHPSLFASFPSLAAGEKRRKISSPCAPRVQVGHLD